jgi:hypothetical protein
MTKQDRLLAFAKHIIDNSDKGAHNVNLNFAIWDNTLYIAPLYAGDHYHSAIITASTKAEFLDRNVLEVSSEAQLHLIFWGEYWNDAWKIYIDYTSKTAKIHSREEYHYDTKDDDDLPF